MPDALADDETIQTCRMRGTDGAKPRCVALVGRIGEAVSCAIYEWRPDPCIEFAPHGVHGIANEACNRLRHRHGLPALPDQDRLQPTVGSQGGLQARLGRK